MLLSFVTGTATAPRAAAQPAPVDTAQVDTVLAVPDSVAAAADTSVAAPPDTAVADTASTPRSAQGSGVVTVGRERAPRAAREAPDKPDAFSAPGWVMLRSAVFPGWGQWHNRQWLKALVIGGVEGWMAYRIYDDNWTLNNLQLQVNAARDAGDQDLANALALQYNDRLDTMVARQWLLAGVVAYSLLDAYVDAHFRGFDVEFDSDPALEDGKPSSFGVRAGLRWTF